MAITETTIAIAIPAFAPLDSVEAVPVGECDPPGLDDVGEEDVGFETGELADVVVGDPDKDASKLMMTVSVGSHETEIGLQATCVSADNVTSLTVSEGPNDT
jgi:hypothetical protein